MKKSYIKSFILIIFILLIGFITSGCDKSETKINSTINSIKLSNKNKSIIIDCSLDILNINKTEKIDKMYFHIWFENKDIKIRKEIEITNDKNILLEYDLNTDCYYKDINVDFNVKTSKDKKITSEVYNTDLYMLIKNDKENSIAQEMMKEINKNNISIYDINYDYNSYSIINNTLNNTVSIENNNKNTKFIINNDNNLLTNDNFKFYFNNKLINKENITIDDNKLFITYSISTELISIIELELDLSKTEIKQDNKYYNVSLNNKGYEVITILVILKSEYTFGNNVKLILNGKEVKKDKFNIEDKTLKYVFNDPNWSPIY